MKRLILLNIITVFLCSAAISQKNHALGLEVGQIVKNGVSIHYEWMRPSFAIAVEGGFRHNPYRTQAGIYEYDYYTRTKYSLTKPSSTIAYDAPPDYGDFWPKTSFLLSVRPKLYWNSSAKNSLIFGFSAHLNYLKGYEVTDDKTLLSSSSSSTGSWSFSGTNTDYWHLKRTVTAGAQRYTVGVSFHVGYQLMLARNVSFAFGVDLGRILQGELDKSNVYELKPMIIRPIILAKYHFNSLKSK